MAVMVVGAGFNGTGTGALTAALDRLGLGPCLDLREWRAHPEQLPAWEEATNGGPADWDAVLGRYRSTVGWPSCHFWRELSGQYPAARVILTVRDPQVWYQAASATIFASLRDPPKDGAGPTSALRLLRRIILEQTFGGSTEDAALAIEVLAMHEREVKEAIPTERLLVYEVSQGWEPLCRFLGVNVPEVPFPSAAAPG